MTGANGQSSIVVQGLGKRYQIGARPGTGSLYDRFARTIRRKRPDGDHPSIWALHDISFEVPTGHVLGVLGRNGSGKSTLMKILSRVTAPTEGHAETHGRVGALLQVGTGFHPELTGRDNIVLSGAILGMGGAEVKAVRDKIIDFAEIGPFLDTAVKHYSSGMYLRLAFSVSAHLAADIMLIDEVLAVGDEAFQKKCRERIRELASEGRTVLFVSHNLDSVKQICDSAIYLDGGVLKLIGTTEACVREYRADLASA